MEYFIIFINNRLAHVTQIIGYYCDRFIITINNLHSILV